VHKIACPLFILSYSLLYKDFMKTVDNYVGIVYKGHNSKLSFRYDFIKNRLKNKAILVKDIKIRQHVSRETR